MDQLVKITEDKCTLCYACVRICPVKAIEVKANQTFARIIASRCIGCGSCLGVCPENAIKYRDSKEETKALLLEPGIKVAIVAPSISGEFDDITDYRKFVKMIKTLGFDKVNEASFGCDLVARKYASLLNDFKGKYYITAHCPPVVKLVEKFYPEMVINLVPIITPMIATTQVVREINGPDCKVVYICPCIAAKDEALQYTGTPRQVDAVLTFVELRQLFEEFGITEKALEFSEFDEPIGDKGSLYPISNGWMQSVDLSEDLMNGTIITAEGRNNILEAVSKFNASILMIRRHFNLFYCEGCIMGPGTSPGGQKYIRRTLVTDYANKRARNFDRDKWKKNIENFENLAYDRQFQPDDQRVAMPPEEKIEEILKTVGKENYSDNLWGCGACGYGNCREFAVAVANGLAKTDMCLSFTLKNRQEYIKTLKSTNEKLAKTQEALRESEKIARQEKETAREAQELTVAMLQKLPAGVVIIDNKMKIILSNHSFVNILGADAKEIDEIIPGLAGADLKTLLPYPIYNLFTYVLNNNENILDRDVHLENSMLNVSVFTIKKNKIVGAVIRDMYDPEVRNEEVIKRVTNVIDKNLEMVQKIGFLLGEGASDIEQMLNSIIESHKTIKKKPE